MDDLDPVATLSVPRPRLVGGEQPRVHQLVQHLLGGPVVGEGREQLPAVDRGARALRSHQVAQDVPYEGVPGIPDPLQRLFGVLGQGPGDAPGLLVGGTREQLLPPVPLAPETRHGEGEKR